MSGRRSMPVYEEYVYEDSRYPPQRGRSLRPAHRSSQQDYYYEPEYDLADGTPSRSRSVPRSAPRSGRSASTRDSRHSERRQRVYEFEEDDYPPVDRRSSSLKLVKPTLERSGSALPRILLLSWALFMILAWILLVAAFASADWVEGTEATGVAATPFLQREVGVFRQCNTFSGGSAGKVENCFDVGLNDANIDEWEASGALFIVGMIFLTITIVLALVAAIGAVGVLVPWAKIMMAIANLFFIIAFLLVPLGFNELDDPCPTFGDQGQCGLSCNSPTQDFDNFVLCGPYELGSGAYLAFAGLVILFLSALFAACVRVVT